MSIQVKAPVAAEIWVMVKALAVSKPLEMVLPALNPNQPTHNKPAPIMVMTKLLGVLTNLG